MLVWLRASSMSPVTAVMASGVSCRFWLRNCAVTVISSSWSLASGCCASAAPLASSRASETPRDTRVFLYMIPPLGNLCVRSVGEGHFHHGITRGRMETDQVETLFDAVRVLAHQRVDPPGLSGLERVDDGMVLAMCVVQ